MVDRAEGVFQQMIDKGVKPDIQTYTCLIHGYLSTGQWKEVVQRLKEMYTRGLRPNVVTYNTVIDGLCKAHAVNRAEGVLQQMIDKGVKPNIWTYSDEARKKFRRG